MVLLFCKNITLKKFSILSSPLKEITLKRDGRFIRCLVSHISSSVTRYYLHSETQILASQYFATVVNEFWVGILQTYNAQSMARHWC